VPAVIGVREPEALRVILQRADAVGAPAQVLGRDFDAERAADGRARVRVGSRVLTGLPRPLPGDHQLDNLACAIAALIALQPAGLRVPRAAIERGLSRVRWPARLERVRGAPSELLDAAHNPEGAEALARYLGTQPKRGPRVLVFGTMADKDYGPMLRTLAPCFERVFVCRPQKLPRTAEPAALLAHVAATATRSASDALARAQGRRTEGLGGRGRVDLPGRRAAGEAARASQRSADPHVRAGARPQ
jgi:dihydrofolate synthase/folylpolyglutamate synthase